MGDLALAVQVVEGMIQVGATGLQVWHDEMLEHGRGDYIGEIALKHVGLARRPDGRPATGAAAGRAFDTNRNSLFHAV